MQEQPRATNHTLSLDNRNVLNITGVSDVRGFDEETVNIVTLMGVLIVKGTDLHISKLSLDTYEVSIDGEINSLHYLKGSEKKNLMSRLFG